MRALILMVSFLVALPVNAASPELKPVPDNMLQDNKLVVSKGGFSVNTLKGDWKWFQFNKNKTTYGYMLLNKEKKERYLITINSKTYPTMTQMVAVAYMNNIAKSYKSKGFKISDVKLNQVKHPVPSSYQLSYESTINEGNKTKTYTRLFTKQYLYMISYTTDDMGRARERRFDNFVAGFKFIK